MLINKLINTILKQIYSPKHKYKNSIYVEDVIEIIFE